ncbi:Mov34/MPN/PAD-1 family protein [Chloroflexota bacterium]
MPLIRLEPPKTPKPRKACIPMHRALHWKSPVENGATEPAVLVFVAPRAFKQINDHARSDLDNEVGGWLIGKWRQDKTSDRQYIVVENNLPAPFTRQGRAFLTFTQDTQVALKNLLEERFPSKELVGWYHTHPNMGIFLSSYDSWLHDHFFSMDYQVALVVEPHTSTGGFFIRGMDGGLDSRRYYGFYELINRKWGSVVHWPNIFPAAENLK